MGQRFLLLLSLLLLLSGFLPACAAELSGRVSWVYDGDTLLIDKIGKVRLLGIDTPEYQASARDAFYRKNFQLGSEQLRDIAQRAKNYNIRKAKGKTVRLEFDRAEKDKYGRLLAYVYLPGGDMLNLLLLDNGLASVFRRYDFRFKKDFLSAEKTAQGRKVGLWEK